MIDLPRDGHIKVSDRNGPEEAAGNVGMDTRAPHPLGDHCADGLGGGNVGVDNIGVDARAPHPLGDNHAGE
jgi:hypothetical protein